jgi:hypothetical protein
MELEVMSLMGYKFSDHNDKNLIPFDFNLSRRKIQKPSFTLLPY